MTDRRAERLAENESRFRDVNERMRQGLRGVVPDDEQLPFICECSAVDCDATISLTLAEYEAVRVDPRQFAVRPGHEVPDVEYVVSDVEYVVSDLGAGRAAIIRKRPPADAVAVGRDPRR